MHRSRRLRRERGMSLVEVMATTAFVAVALVGTGAAVIESSELTRTNSQTRAVSATFSSLLEEVRATPFNQVDATFANVRRTVETIPEAPSGATASFEVTDVPTGSIRWQVRRVAVTLAWDGRSGPTSMRAVTYASDRTTAGAPLFGSGTTGLGGLWSSGTGDPVDSTGTTTTTTTTTTQVITDGTTTGGTQ